MPAETLLFRSDHHANILVEDLSGQGLAIQENHHLIVHGGEAMLLDPGGHKVFDKLCASFYELAPGASLRYVFLSHQDPDVVAAVNGWLLVTEACALLPEVWARFLPHFGIDEVLEERLRPVPDRGDVITLGGAPLWLLPAHFLHSAGNLQVYDPTSKVLYSGDLGASFEARNREVVDFEAHLPLMQPFHERYMPSPAALRAWVAMVRPLEIEILAPQHGALFRGKALINRFLDWCEQLACGPERLAEVYRLPRAS